MEYSPNIKRFEAAFISPVRSYGYVFTYTGGKQRQLKGVLSYFKVEMESIARSALHFEIVGMEKHIVTLLYGPMTAEQKSTVKQKSTIQPNHVLRALKWLVQYNTEWKERNVGSPQVSFLMCTLEIPQKIAVQVLLLLTLFTFTFEPFLKL